MKLNEIEKLKSISKDQMLSEWCNSDGSAVKVDSYFDESGGTAYQVDRKNLRFRMADSKIAGSYGDWKRL